MEYLENLRIVIAMESENDNINEFENFLCTITVNLPIALTEILKERFDLELNNEQKKQIELLSQNIKEFDQQNMKKAKEEQLCSKKKGMVNNSNADSNFINRNQKRIQICNSFNEKEAKRFKIENALDKQSQEENQNADLVKISSSLPVEMEVQSEKNIKTMKSQIVNKGGNFKNEIVASTKQFKEKNINIWNNSSTHSHNKKFFGNEEEIKVLKLENKKSNQQERGFNLKLEKFNSTNDSLDKFRNNEDIFSASTLFNFK